MAEQQGHGEHGVVELEYAGPAMVVFLFLVAVAGSPSLRQLVSEGPPPHDGALIPGSGGASKILDALFLPQEAVSVPLGSLAQDAVSARLALRASFPQPALPRSGESQKHGVHSAQAAGYL